MRQSASNQSSKFIAVVWDEVAAALQPRALPAQDEFDYLRKGVTEKPVLRRESFLALGRCLS
jgi:hypothetical protein